MSTALAKLKSHVVHWREWELNAIVIKELRQAVRSWAVTGMLLLFLVVLFVTSLAFLVSHSFSGNLDVELGKIVFYTFVAILALSSFMFIPLYLGLRLAAERQENNLDLLYISTLSPGQIIRGKFLCGAYMAVLFFSACMPFMAFTNLLRGVDLPSIFFILFVLFLMVCAVNQLAIFLACLPLSRAFKILLGLYGFFQLMWMVLSLVFGSLLMIRSGVGATMGTSGFWINTATAMAIGAAAVGLFYFLSVALITPPSANRALPVRVYVTVIWVLGGMLSIAWMYHQRTPVPLLWWARVSLILMVYALLVVISNSDQLSRRVRRRIPESRTRRIPAFLLFNGAAGGLIWIVIIVLATFFITSGVFWLRESWAVSYRSSGPEQQRQFFEIATPMMTYAFAYALTALFIQRKFLSRRPPKLAGLLAVLLAALWAIIPGIVLFFMNRLSLSTMQGLQLGNVFNVAALRNTGERFYHLIFALAWLAVALVLNARWFLAQVKNFCPPRQDAPPVIGEVPPPLPGST